MHLLSIRVALGLCAVIDFAAPAGDERAETPPVQRPQEAKEDDVADPTGEPPDPPSPSEPELDAVGDESPPSADAPHAGDASSPLVNEAQGEEIELSPTTSQSPDFVANTLDDDSPAGGDPSPSSGEYGPFYEEPPPSDLAYPGERRRKGPVLSIAGGAFCLVEDSACKSAAILDADVGAGLNIVTSEHGLDVPYTQFRVRWGVTVRPVAIGRKSWHAWGVGAVGSWSIGSASIIPANDTSEADELAPIEAYRVALINQIWLTRKRSAAHLDVTIGAVNSRVLEFSGRFWGTHVEAALGLGGWGQVFLGADFLDRDVRTVVGIRGHGIVTGPMIGLVVLGLLAGGVAL